MTLTEKAALVSGAAGGIGRAISIAFAEAGAAVACCEGPLIGGADLGRAAATSRCLSFRVAALCGCRVRAASALFEC